MADNFISYKRFTTLPVNISDFGYTKEEVELQKGAPDANPALSPLASPRIPERQLALAPGGSDKLRLNDPPNVQVNPYEGPRPAVVVLRGAMQKLSSGVFNELKSVVQTVPDGTVRGLMDDSLNRVASLNALTERTVSWMAFIESMALSTSRG